MSAKHPNILYVGHPCQATCLQLATQGNDWCIYTPASLMQALAFYVFYVPDLVILDTTHPTPMTGDDLHMIYEHLLSVNAEPILLVTDNYLEWQVPIGQQIGWLPANSPIDNIIDMACSLIEEKTGQYPAISFSVDS